MTQGKPDDHGNGDELTEARDRFLESLEPPAPGSPRWCEKCGGECLNRHGEVWDMIRATTDVDLQSVLLTADVLDNPEAAAEIVADWKDCTPKRRARWAAEARGEPLPDDDDEFDADGIECSFE